MKYEVIQLTMEVVRGSKTAMILTANNNNVLLAWGSMIETYDAFIGIYYQKDELYYDTRSRIKNIISKTNPLDYSTKNRTKLKRLYDAWFRLICVKLTVFKIFPPLPVTYAQGIGEINEEIRLLQAEEDEKGADEENG